MKVLLTADVHLHKHKKSDDRLQDCLKAMAWVFETAKARDIKNIIICGDLFHEKQRLDVETYQLAFKLFQNYCGEQGLNAWVLMGNHDMYHKHQWEVSSIIPLGAIPNIQVINSPCTIDVDGYPFSFLPYTENPIGDIRELPSTNLAVNKILCGHLAVNGAILNSVAHTVADVPVEHDGDMMKLEVDHFNAWDQVFLGHYHCEQRLNSKVEYIGSPLQLSYGEAHSQKHVIVFNPETLEKEYIINDFSPKHLIVNPKTAKKHELKGNFVRMMVDDLSATDIVDMRNHLLSESNAAQAEILQAPEKASEVNKVEDARAILFKKEEMIDQYVAMIETEGNLAGLDKVRLIEIGKKILEGKKAHE